MLRENALFLFRAVGKGGLDRPSEFYRSVNPISAGEQIFLVFPMILGLRTALIQVLFSILFQPMKISDVTIDRTDWLLL